LYPVNTKTYDKLIEAPELAQIADDAAVAIVDCRFDLARPQWGAAAYAEAHIPGALFADMEKDLSDPVTPTTGRHPLPNVERFAETLGRWGIDDRMQVIAYDQDNGAPASRLWWLLRYLGHTRVAVLNGGFAAWRAAGLPVTSEVRNRASRTFTVRLQKSAVVTTSEVEATLGKDEMTLVDARGADRFAGQNETIDPIAGHVPGALNHPFSRNLGASGRFLDAAELRARWDKTLNGEPADDVVAMCGSGITACHNLLALEVAGLPGARLYAGSWSEWIRDPQRPIETGPV
jgi:thiosulfate/3-mercaptopyruvate sulfurtransferase